MEAFTESVYLAIFREHAAKAVQGMERHGCYWFTGIRPSYGIVVELLEDAGYSVITFNPPPVYEFAIYLSDSYPSQVELERIAMYRQSLRDKGVSEDKLPVSLV
ncbi:MULTISPECIES: hypothetical protein [Enterobacter]|uniref:hypothetical protein n=1 Tax=Enterobacter TaxID=547 RepID=UPI000B8A48AC|nr:MULTISPECIES: hypothetical protein [Enterobacter]MCK6905299.1 hypothetical protein [Enterobacter roggenkampii]WJW93104.1 hypothetical protein QVH37_13915 [Enterobacter pseudoroggenkampii]